MDRTLKVIFIIVIMLFGVFVLTACTFKEGTKGTFYSLQEAYDQGILNVDDLQSIANHYNNRTESTEPLNSSVESEIKKSKVEEVKNLNSNPFPDITVDDVTIVKYYGEYNNAYAIVIKVKNSGHGPGIDPEYVVGGVSFYKYEAPLILIWKK